MSSSAAKGNQFENEVKQHLESEGWMVFRQHKRIAGFIKTPKGLFPRMAGADIFGCDIVAKRKGDMPLWIQVSVEGKQSVKMKELLKYPWHIAEAVEVWVRIHGRKVYRRFVLNRDIDTRETRPFNEAPEVKIHVRQ